jgi:hypothetical protein
MEKELYLFRDKELTSAEQSHLAAHLQECADCRQVLDQLYAMDHLLQPMRTATTTFQANEAVRQGIPTYTSPARRWPWLTVLENGRVRSALAFALLLLFTALAWDQYDTHRQQTRLLQNTQLASTATQEETFNGCRDKVQRWYAGLQKNQAHITPLWSYSAPVRLNPQQRHELTRMLQECGLSDRHIRTIFSEYRI